MFQFGGIGALLGGLSSPKSPRGDGTDFKANTRWAIQRQRIRWIMINHVYHLQLLLNWDTRNGYGTWEGCLVCVKAKDVHVFQGFALADGHVDRKVFNGLQHSHGYSVCVAVWKYNLIGTWENFCALILLQNLLFQSREVVGNSESGKHLAMRFSKRKS